MSGGGRPGPPSWWSCKPGLVSLSGDSHSSRRRVAPQLQQPTRTSRVTFAAKRAASPGVSPFRSLFGLAPEGVWLAAPVTRRTVRSYRTFSPLPGPLGAVLAAVGLHPVARVFGPSLQPDPHAGRYVFCATVPGRPFERCPVAVSNPPALWSPDFPPGSRRATVWTTTHKCTRVSASQQPATATTRS